MSAYYRRHPFPKEEGEGIFGRCYNRFGELCYLNCSIDSRGIDVGYYFSEEKLPELMKKNIYYVLKDPSTVTPSTPAPSNPTPSTTPTSCGRADLRMGCDHESNFYTDQRETAKRIRCKSGSAPRRCKHRWQNDSCNNGKGSILVFSQRPACVYRQFRCGNFPCKEWFIRLQGNQLWS